MSGSTSDTDFGASFTIDGSGFGAPTGQRASDSNSSLAFAKREIEHSVDKAMGGTNDEFNLFKTIDMAAHRGAGGRSKHSIARGLFLAKGLPYPGGRGNSGNVWREKMRDLELTDKKLRKKYRDLMELTAVIVEQTHGVSKYADRMRAALKALPRPWSLP
jgi:hypothetical protein